jgi:hypothetical protein
MSSQSSRLIDQQQAAARNKRILRVFKNLETEVNQITRKAKDHAAKAIRQAQHF